MDNVRRGDIFYADLSPVVGSEQGGTRPVLIVQNDTGNRHSPTVIAAAITSQLGKARLPTHITVTGKHEARSPPHRMCGRERGLIWSKRFGTGARPPERFGWRKTGCIGSWRPG